MHRRRALSAAFALPFVLAITAACGGGGTPAKPSDPAADALARGIAAHNANKLDEAAKDYYEALFYDPKSKFAFYNLGQIARIQSRLAIAEGYYRSALEIDPNYGPALFGLGASMGLIAALTHALNTPDFAMQLAFLIGLGVGGLGEVTSRQIPLL